MCKENCTCVSKCEACKCESPAQKEIVWGRKPEKIKTVWPPINKDE